MNLEIIVKRIIQSLTVLVIAALLLPFVLDYAGESDEGLSKSAFYKANVITMQESSEIWTFLNAQGLLTKQGDVNADIELDDVSNDAELLSIDDVKKHVVLILDQQKSKQLQSQKQVEIIGSSITGYENSQISWKIGANYVYAGRSQYIFTAEGVFSGYIYDQDGLVIIDNIKADSIRMNTKRKTIYAKNNISARFLNKSQQQKLQELKGLRAQDNNDDKPVTIKSDELRFNGGKDTVELSKNVEIKQDDVTIYPKETIFVDNAENTARISNGFQMIATDFSVSGNNMIIYINEDRSEMSGNIIITRKEAHAEQIADQRESELRQEKTVLTCDNAEYIEQDDQHTILVENNVKIVQKGKVITGKQGLYDEANDSYEINDNVKISLDSLDWMLNEETIKNFSNKDVNATVFQKTTITTDKLSFKGDMKKLTLFGHVKVVQEDKIIEANKLIFDDAKSLVYCIGDVRVIKDQKNTIETDFLEIDLTNETFTGKRGVSTTYHID